ncbi:probable methyltransferase-like protein 15 isoform X3 [Tachysurus fulvidraco]|uniref:probable methyltransferase-like protein 15 isoform X3 n=1 Tax=Tachysurus fulvidraco TaxID=1234273 RepID=UPI001FED5764|nr:probable methyltransferase-like protein 15 isoform X3 [Tachysurus fulvidraco]
MTSFSHVFLSSLRLACCGKRRMHKCAYSNSWRKPNQTQSFCSSSSFTPDCQSRSTKHLSLPADQEPHTPVLLKEVLQYMDIKPGQVVLDMTFGGGGHSKAILRSVPGVTLVAVDRDPVAFGFAQKLAEEYPYPGMPCAADAVSALDQRALACVLAAYGEEQHAKKIAAAIVQARSLYPISRTQQLASIVAGAFPASALYARRDRLQRPSHVATKTFQALRILVNDELNELVAGLQTAQDFLRPGGRLCVLTFHSLEDRIAKRFLRGEDLSAPPRRSIRQRARAHLQRKPEEEDDDDAEEEEGGRESVHWVRLQRKVVLPSKEEVGENPRGRSAKLRAAVRR